MHFAKVLPVLLALILGTRQRSSNSAARASPGSGWCSLKQQTRLPKHKKIQLFSPQASNHFIYAGQNKTSVSSPGK